MDNFPLDSIEGLLCILDGNCEILLSKCTCTVMYIALYSGRACPALMVSPYTLRTYFWITQWNTEPLTFSFIKLSPGWLILNVTQTYYLIATFHAQMTAFLAECTFGRVYASSYIFNIEKHWKMKITRILLMFLILERNCVLVSHTPAPYWRIQFIALHVCHLKKLLNWCQFNFVSSQGNTWICSCYYY